MNNLQSISFSKSIIEELSFVQIKFCKSEVFHGNLLNKE